MHLDLATGYYSSIAVNPTNGNPAIAFNEAYEVSLNYAYYVGNGSGNCRLNTNWVCEVVEKNPLQRYGKYASLGFNASGQAMIGYRDENDAAVKYAIRDGGNSGCTGGDTDWSCEGVLTTGNVGYNVALAVDGNNKAGIAHKEEASDDLLYAYRVGGGGGSGCSDSDWTCVVVDTANNSGDGIDLAFDSSNKAGISYLDITSQTLRYAFNVGSDGTGCTGSTNAGTWYCETVASTTATGALVTAIAFDSSNYAAIAYYDAAGTDLEYALRNLGNSGCSDADWTCESIMTIDSVGSYPSLVFNGGIARIATLRTTGNDLIYTFRTPSASCDNANWTCEVVYSTNNSGYYNGLAFNGSNQAVISYLDSTDRDLMFAVRDSGNSNCADADWTCTDIEGNSMNVIKYVSLKYDNTNVPAVVYKEDTNDNLIYARYVGTGGTGCFDAAWTCETVYSTGNIGERPSLAFNSSGVAGISFYNTDTADLMYAFRTAGSGCADSDWTCETVNSTFDVGSYSSLAYDSSNKAGIGYFNETSDDLIYAYRVGGGGGSGCDDTDWTYCEALDTTDDQGRYVSLAFHPTTNDASGNDAAALSYKNDTADDLRYALRDGGNTGCGAGDADWTCINVHTTSDAGNYSSIAFNASNVATISFQNATASDLMYAINDGGGGGSDCTTTSWTCETVKSSGTTGLNTSLAHINGNAVIAYYDSTNGDAEYTRRVGSGSGSGCADTDWRCETIHNGDHNSGDDGVSIAISGGSNVGVAYTAFTSRGIMYTSFIDNTASSVGYTADNVIPTAQVTQATDGTGIMTVTFKIKDLDGNADTLNTFEYSVNGGSSWSAPTNGDTSQAIYISTAGDNWSTKAGANYSTATTLGAATAHSFKFNTKHANLTGLNSVDQSDVQVRFKANDGVVSSAFGVSENFSVDNLNPATLTQANIVSRPNAGNITVTVSASFTEGNPNTNQFYAQINNGGYGSATNGTSNTAAPSNQATTIAAVDGDDCVTDVKVVHTDDFGNAVTNENTSPSVSCVLPYTPVVPTVSSTGPNDIRVIINAHGSETGAVQYAVRARKDSVTKYLAANGTLADSEDWTLSASQPLTVTGLLSSSSYIFDVKARNPNDTANTETNFSGTATVLTQYDRPMSVKYDDHGSQNVNRRHESVNLNTELLQEVVQEKRAIDEKIIELVKEDPVPISRSDPFLGLTLTLSSDSRGIILQWKDPHFEEPKIVELYRNYAPVRTSLTLYQGLNFGDQTYLDTNVEPGKAYYYQVKALSQTNNFVSSAILGIKIPGNGNGYVPPSLVQDLLDALIGVINPF